MSALLPLHCSGCWFASSGDGFWVVIQRSWCLIWLSVGAGLWALCFGECFLLLLLCSSPQRLCSYSSQGQFRSVAPELFVCVCNPVPCCCWFCSAVATFVVILLLLSAFVFCCCCLPSVLLLLPVLVFILLLLLSLPRLLLFPPVPVVPPTAALLWLLVLWLLITAAADV